MLLTTTPTIEGRKILEYKGVVTGETIIGANVLKDFFAGIRDIIGGRSNAYEKVLREAKDTSLHEMQERLRLWARMQSWVLTSIMKPLDSLGVC